MNRRVSRSLVLASGVALAAGSVLAATPAVADELSASSFAQLVAAINTANTNGHPENTIELTGTGFAVTADLPIITTPVHLSGPGASTFTLTFDGVSDWIGISFEEAGASSVSGITIAGSPWEGIWAYDTSLDVSDVVVTGAQNGIVIRDSLSSDAIELVLSITDSAFNSNEDVGIDAHIQGQSTLLIDGVETTDNGLDGMRLEVWDDAVATLSGVTVTENGDGLDLTAREGGLITVTDSDVNDNDADGFDIWASGGTVDLTDVRVVRSGDNGIEISLQDEIYDDLTFSGAVTITDSLVQQSGGDGVNVEILDEGTLDISTTTIETSDESGVRIDNGDADDDDQADGAQVTITASTIRDNGDTGIQGGGMNIAHPLGLLVLIDSSTISGNTAQEGGAIFADGEELGLVISNSTVSGNTAGYFGGIGIWGDQAGGVLALLNSTVTTNTATVAGASGVEVGEEIEPLISNSVIAGNTGGSADLFFIDPIGTINHSFIGSGNVDVDTVFAAGTGNIAGANPQLGPLADNGGPTLTHLPLPGSPVINKGDPDFTGLDFDQRGEGFPRQIGVLDMGAVEVPRMLPASGSELTGALAAGLGLLLLGGLVLGIRRRPAGS